MPSLITPLQSLRGVGPVLADKFKQLGLVTLQDALFYFPFRHEDWRQSAHIADLKAGQQVTVLVTIEQIMPRRAFRKKMSLTEASVTDDSGALLHVVWFNQPYLATTLKAGDKLYLSGTVTVRRERLQMDNPTYERWSTTPTHAKLVPVYRLTEGLTQRQVRNVMKQAVAMVTFVPEIVPDAVLHRFRLMSRQEALRQIHFPDSPELAAQAVTRLKFDELLIWYVRLQEAAASQQQHPALGYPFHEIPVRKFVQSLPFELTNDQRIAAWQVFQDMGETKAMSRLLQGDVGSGKTVVAALAAYNTALSGGQCVVLVPTVLLAQQHWQSFLSFFRSTEVTLGLLTSQGAKISPSENLVSPDDLERQVTLKKINIMIGTHAILENGLSFGQLGLVVVDEQQRFGVEQRQTLIRRQHEQGQPTPHFLSLTATPIPRTLALFVSGQLSLSTLKEKPAGRARITTKVVTPTQRKVIAQEIEATLARKEQVYVITPLIAESDILGVRAATQEFERWKKALPKARIGLVHGSLPAAERLATMEAFRGGTLDMLVSTTVLEVGIDVPNATLMVIEGAERYGLAQLHQLRGRVGRSDKPSTALLATDLDLPDIRHRLEQVARIDNGFELAELDLKERGSGQLFGVRQSGLPDWQLATFRDTELMSMVQDAAKLLATDFSEILKSEVWEHLRDEELVYHRE